MANVALVVANQVAIVESIHQMTLPAGETINPGAPVRMDTATGRFLNANATTAPNARVWGIATGRLPIQAGLVCTAIRRGVLDGYNFAVTQDSPVYVSDTAGALSDTAGTVSTVVGRVIPGTSTTLGTAYDKLLSVEL